MCVCVCVCMFVYIDTYTYIESVRYFLGGKLSKYIYMYMYVQGEWC